MAELIFVLCAAASLLSMTAGRAFFKNFILSSLSGICALLSVNFIGSFISVGICVNAFTLLFSSVFGCSGVILLLCVDTLTKIFL